MNGRRFGPAMVNALDFIAALRTDIKEYVNQILETAIVKLEKEEQDMAKVSLCSSNLRGGNTELKSNRNVIVCNYDGTYGST